MENYYEDNLNDLTTDTIALSIKDQNIIQTIFGVVLDSKSDLVIGGYPQTDVKDLDSNLDTDLKKNETVPTLTKNKDILKNLLLVLCFLVLSLPKFDLILYKIDNIYTKLAIKITIFSLLLYMIYSFN